jgi:hypothetical protein
MWPRPACARPSDGVNIFRIRDGRVVELWNHRDDLGLMEQAGAPAFAGSPRDPDGPTADGAGGVGIADAGR